MRDNVGALLAALALLGAMTACCIVGAGVYVMRGISNASAIGGVGPTAPTPVAPPVYPYPPSGPSLPPPPPPPPPPLPSSGAPSTFLVAQPLPAFQAEIDRQLRR